MAKQKNSIAVRFLGNVANYEFNKTYELNEDEALMYVAIGHAQVVHKQDEEIIADKEI